MNLMNLKSVAFGAAFILAGVTSAQADDHDLLPQDQIPGEFSASLTLATDYIWRGVSQTDNEPAVQGSFDYSLDTGFHDIGFYAGTWASNVQFGGAGTPGNANAEWDFYAGFSGSVPVADGISWDVGYLLYHFPGSASSNNADMDEWHVALGYDFGYFDVGGSYNYTPDYTGGADDGHYYTVDVGVPVWKSVALFGHYGWQDIEVGDSYGDWNIGASATVLGFDWSVAYMETYQRAGTDDEHVVGTFSASF